MAHKVLGVDFGSTSLKMARFDVRFRAATLLDVWRHTLPEPQPALTDPAARIAADLTALKKVITEERLAVDELIVALPGDLVTFRLVDLPFSDPRRIDSVLGYELESQLMTPIDEVVIDHVIVGPRGADTRVLAAAAPRAVVRAIVDTATAEQLAVRIVVSTPLGVTSILEAAQTDAPGASMAIDIGNDATSVCIVRDRRPEMARSIGRGGRHFTAAISAAFRLDPRVAEQAKIDSGFIGHAGMVAQSPSQVRMDGCLREAARPLIRELRQTLAAHRAAYAAPVERIWLSGGGSRLVGLPELIAEELGIPVAALPWPADEVWTGSAGKVAPEDRAWATVAVGTALAGVGQTSRLNFRKGEFAYRSDFSFLRGKALYFGLAASAVLLVAILNALIALHALQQEHDHLEARLKRETTELFGEPRTDARVISEELKGPAKGQGPPIPTITAFDVLDEISRAVPPRDKIRLDILELNIEPKKTSIKGTVETAQQSDDLITALRKIDCFEKLQPDKLINRKVPNPDRADPKDKDAKTVASDKEKAERPDTIEVKEFNLSITTTCP